MKRNALRITAFLLPDGIARGKHGAITNLRWLNLERQRIGEDLTAIHENELGRIALFYINQAAKQIAAERGAPGTC